MNRRCSDTKTANKHAVTSVTSKTPSQSSKSSILAQVMSCLFCRIIDGEIPSTKVAESKLSFAFRDLHPTASTHVLVIPKLHIAHAGEISSNHGVEVADLFVMAQQVAVIDGLTQSGYRLVFNVGKDSGNTVDHLHLHVIGGRAMGWPPFTDA